MAPKKKEVHEKLLLGRNGGNLRMGLVGMPNVGKSTTFNLLCKQSAPAENYPFCTIAPHEARMNVPDDRFKWLCEHHKPKSEVSANLTIFDIAGLVPNAHLGEGLGNSFLSNIQAVDGIYHVIRAFDSSDIIHTEGSVDPIRDVKVIYDELLYKDLARVEGLVADYDKLAKRDKTKKGDAEIMHKVHEHLKGHEWISKGDWKPAEAEVLNTIMLLTAKPIVHLVNMSEKDFIRLKNKFLPGIKKWADETLHGPIIPYSAEFEEKMAEFETDDERKQYLEQTGAKMSMVDKIIKEGYHALHLIHYFTAGEDEVKCWTVREHTKAPQAAGIIHTDFEKGFICAEIMRYEDLHELGNELQVKSHGKMHQKGKEYMVEDGDIIFFKFNVPTGGPKKK
eukprot:Platyproteum_vivax@DN4725_c0_g1_i1.p1